MSKTHVSLREIARRLDIPPSTVVYYKDRFQRFIPFSGGQGRRRTYPLAALQIFREIRSMYENNWSAEQIEQELAARCADILGRDALLPGGEGPDRAGSSELVRSVAEVLDKMSGLLEERRLYRAEIASLRAEAAALRQEREQGLARHQEQVAGLRQEMDEMREQNQRMERYIEARIRRDNVLHAKPPQEFLGLPLVIQSGQGEFLGVSGRGGRPFSLQNLITMVQRNASADRTVDLHWDREGDGWVLAIHAHDRAQDRALAREQDLRLTVTRIRTPSRNVVALLTSMAVDGAAVPEPYLLSLFRQIRDSFAV